MRSKAVPVTAPVTAKVGIVQLCFFPYSVTQVGVDEIEVLPWAWCAMCRVKFKIGELTVTKKVRQRVVFGSKPSDIALMMGREAVLAHLRDELARHGFDPPELVVEERPYEPRPAF